MYVYTYIYIYMYTAEVPNFEDKIGLRTKIPIPVRKLMRAKRKLNLASHDND